MIGSLFALVGPHDDEPVDLVAATVVLEVHRVVDVAYAPPHGRSRKRESVDVAACSRRFTDHKNGMNVTWSGYGNKA